MSFGNHCVNQNQVLSQSPESDCQSLYQTLTDRMAVSGALLAVQAFTSCHAASSGMYRQTLSSVCLGNTWLWSDIWTPPKLCNMFTKLQHTPGLVTETISSKRSPWQQFRCWLEYRTLRDWSHMRAVQYVCRHDGLASLTVVSVPGYVNCVEDIQHWV